MYCDYVVVKVHKTYLAIVAGTVQPRTFTVDAPLFGRYEDRPKQVQYDCTIILFLIESAGWLFCLL